MARVEVSDARPTYTLTLTEEEAAYVFNALQWSAPLPANRFGDDEDDPVYDALFDALPMECRHTTYARTSTSEKFEV